MFRGIALLFAFAAVLHAQLASPPTKPVVGARQPALSPDGRRLAFVYRGDIWMTEAAGGRAVPLTEHVETDAYPLFSPDGQWIAFASRRSGNWDIFAIPATGGRPTQLTWHSGTDIPYGWSPDGTQLLFSSKRDSANYGLFAVDVKTLRTHLLTEDYATLSSPNFSPSGREVVYARYGFPWTRPRYAGSAAAEVWLLDVAKGVRRALTTNQFQHLWPRFMPDGRILAVTCDEITPSSSKLGEVVSPIADNPRRTPNLWLFDTNGQGRQMTTFVGDAVRWPAVAAKSGDIAFEYGSDIYLRRAGTRDDRKLSLFAYADEKQTTQRREKVSSGVTEAEPSPDGKTFAFGLHDDIWTISTEKPKGVAGRAAEYATRLTDWAGEDADFSWSKDGKKLYFVSDRDFFERLYELDVKTRKVEPLWERKGDIEHMKISPDGRQLGFWVAGAEGGLYTLTLSNRETRRIVRAPGPQWRGQGGGDFEWSPDMRWICYAYRGESKAYNLWIVPANGSGEARNVTRLYAYHGQPAWSPDGKYLFFQSNRDGNGLYVLPLTREDVRVADTDLKFLKPTNDVTVKIEFEDIHRRIRKVTSQMVPQSDLTVTAEGLIVCIADGEVSSISYDGKETKHLTGGGNKSQLRVSRDGKTAYFVGNGELFTLKLDGGKEQKVTFNAEWERNLRAERQAAFTQFWRSYQRGFYDANFHGRDWERIRERYEPLLEAVETGDEFAGLLGMMIGELETSHAEVTAGTNGSGPSPTTPLLGFTFDYQYSGPGLKVKDVPRGTPGWYEKTRLSPGDIVLAINGQDVALDENLYRIINDKQDRDFEFLVSTNGDKAGARTVRYRVLTGDEWTQLNYQNRVEHLRDYVDEKSQGRIGYLHIASMGAQNQAQFEREAYEYIVGKEAMIIDVRFNTGGNIADTLVEWLQRKPHGWVRPRDGVREPVPFHAWDRKMVVLMNEHSFSNAEIFPSAMRARGLAQLVGRATPGYVIWTESLSLVDGTRARMPMTGAYRLDGSPMENNGELPDFEVVLTPDDWMAGRDPQLDKAIDLLSHGALAHTQAGE